MTYDFPHYKYPFSNSFSFFRPWNTCHLTASTEHSSTSATSFCGIFSIANITSANRCFSGSSCSARCIASPSSAEVIGTSGAVSIRLPIETERLVVRGFLPDLDAKPMFRVYGDAEVMRFIPGGAVSDERAVRSLLERHVETQLLPVARELGVGVVACSPLARGLLTGRLTSTAQLTERDYRRNHPRFEPDNFAAVVARMPTGRYPYGIALSEDDRDLFVTNVGVFQYTHLTPEPATSRPVLGQPSRNRHWTRRVRDHSNKKTDLASGSPRLQPAYVIANVQPGL